MREGTNFKISDASGTSVRLPILCFLLPSTKYSQSMHLSDFGFSSQNSLLKPHFGVSSGTSVLPPNQTFFRTGTRTCLPKSFASGQKSAIVCMSVEKCYRASKLNYDCRDHIALSRVFCPLQKQGSVVIAQFRDARIPREWYRHSKLKRGSVRNLKNKIKTNITCKSKRKWYIALF